MYDAYLSHWQLKKYLEILIETDMLQYNSQNNSFIATGEGKTFLKTYKSLDQLAGLSIH
jgi:predicted transcriptional regulator